jgi:UDP-N-acetylglucosamine 2-epimerase
MPNADTDGRVIINLIEKYVAENPERTISFKSLGQSRYLSALKHVNVVIGNSSSGLIEVPSFGIPTINIGDRQKGRVAGPTVINTGTNYKEISESIKKALSTEFRNDIKSKENPYDQGYSSDKIIKVLKEYPLENILKKKFYNLK